MRGLTPEEYEMLSHIAGPIRRMSDPGAEAVRTGLLEQGRVVLGPPRLPGSHEGWYITPSGREALRLYPLMLALQAQP